MQGERIEDAAANNAVHTLYTEKLYEVAAEFPNVTIVEEKDLWTPMPGSNLAEQNPVGWLADTVHHSALAAKVMANHAFKTFTRADTGVAPGPANGDPNHSLPPGTIVDFAGAAAPAGWLLCQGQTLNESAYPELYAAIGNQWGSSGAGTFKLPDTRGRVTVAGSGEAGSPFNTIASNVGSTTHTLTKAQIPNLETESAGSHTHSAPDSGYRIVTTTRDEFAKRTGSSWSSGAWVPALTDNINNVFTLANAGAHTHVVNSGGGNPFSIVQPSIVMHKIIKT